MSKEIRSLYLNYFLPQSIQPISVYWLLEGYLSDIPTENHNKPQFIWETEILNSIVKQIDLLNVPHTKWIEKLYCVGKPLIMLLHTSLDSFITIELSVIG